MIIASEGPPLWQFIVGGVFGTGALWKLLELWLHRRRIAFGDGPRIDDDLNVYARLEQRGTSEGSVTSVVLVVVVSRFYRLIHQAKHDVVLKHGIAVSDELLKTKPTVVKRGHPVIVSGQARNQNPLPRPWRPLSSMTMARPKPGSIRLKIETEGGGRFPSYSRLKRTRGTRN